MQECIPLGCVPPASHRTMGGLCPEGSLSKGSLCSRGLCLEGLCPGGISPRGVSVQGMSVQGGLPDRDPPVSKITDRCKKHYLAATSLRAVKI